ncbi:tryptophan 7-halogenase [Colwellia sp. KU-HH00111]
MDSINNIVIVGGGTAGWTTAACLARVLNQTKSKITLIDSPEVATIGVGEATIPPLVEFMRFLGVNEQEFVRKTQATFKLAIKFTDWNKVGEHYWHQFGSVGADIDGKPFYQHWYKSRLQGNQNNYTDYSPAIAMAKKNKFAIPDPRQQSILNGATYAWHFDALLVANFLTEYSVELGVDHIRGHVESIAKHDNGFIKSVFLKNGQIITGDFFIDCTGQKALLIEGAMGAKFESWQHYLPMNRSIALQTENHGELVPYTESIAHPWGWQWRIPLQHRTGNGMVFCDKYCTDEDALIALTKNISGKQLTEPRFISFATGKRKELWKGNCLALGLSSGFLEPLESTAIHLMMKGVIKFAEMLPDKYCHQATINEYNRIMDIEYLSIRDFIILHYCTTSRTDSPFWQDCQNMPIPDSLAEKLALFKNQGRLFRSEFDLFTPPSWYAILAGMNIKPDNYDRLIDISDTNQVNSIMNNGLHNLNNTISQLPSHETFIKQFALKT